jgi:formate hydrogenlyase subunit 3/multisubunit Na+/H+ antiporter MnhD subunit
MPGLVAIPIVVPLAGTLVLLLLNRAAGPRNRSPLTLFIIGSAFLVLLTLARNLPASTTISQWQPFLGIDLAYHVDGLAFLFAALMALMGLATIAPCLGHSESPEGSSYATLLALLAAGFSFVFSANLITLCASWVIFDLAFLWAIAASDRGESRATSPPRRCPEVPPEHDEGLVEGLGGAEGRRSMRIVRRVLNLSCLACLSLLAAALLLGDDSLSLRSSSISAPVFGLIMLVALIRVGLYPLHIWMPIGVEASLPARSLLHLVPTSVGLYLLARLSVWINGSVPYGQALAIAGSLAFFVGALLAWAEADLSKTLSFTMISQVGYAIVSLAVAKVPAIVVLPGLNLVLCLGLLFLSQDRCELGSLWSKAASGLAMASLAGVPLTLGFIGRWHLYHFLLTGGHLAFLALSLLAETFLFAALLRMWSAISMIHVFPPEFAYQRSSVVGAALLAVPVVILGLHSSVLRPLMEAVTFLNLVDLLRATTIVQWVALFSPLLGGYLLQRHRQSIFDPVEPFWLKLTAALRLEWLYGLLGRVASGAADALWIAGRVSEGRGYLGWIAVVGLLAFLLLRGI